jgi:hypothetical protein
MLELNMRSALLDSVTRLRDLTPRRSNSHLETVRNPTRARDEYYRDVGSEDFARRLLEKHQPSIEMFALQRQRQMRPHRAAAVPSRPQHDRGPEIGDLPDMVFPILYCGIEDRTDQAVFTSAAIERSDKKLDRRLVDFRTRRLDGAFLGHRADLAQKARKIAAFASQIEFNARLYRG